jgi:hypothetical protein
MERRREGRPKPRILHGNEEPFFAVAPQDVLENLSSPASESALLWNLIYPLCTPTLSLRTLIEVKPLWGTVQLQVPEDRLRPYFWGYDTVGDRLEGLDEVLEEVDGKGPKTAVDLLLLGAKTLVVAEAKHLAALGRCSRFERERCPEVHARDGWDEKSCRYWEADSYGFRKWLAFGDRPGAGEVSPHCWRHYQLARTLLVGAGLADWLDRELHLWLLAPRSHWRALESDWLAFAERVREDGLWKRLRVIPWEGIRALAAP